ncbi:hypothetical protein SCATT_17090 [Streptantibioticus cattleyicolor NRRL 8057 = DSM 46488]|uniref:N-acetyltransferase domain-containing protein n=1 Tax=Streptantibioticus cattleyicolor (strain ATCC 35852 / DSM 46488 / JCM 4925 / NBRC 14057 / NRRL 8057) TaxID=1003195 RepID=G8WP47_STREN|nr:hypothetical protein SCATT_17090 [Streptantibioticus cattleyicolor NRRL 8057 = DSM 46488]
MTEVVTLPRFRGRGWASELLREVCSEADREGVELVLKVETSPGGLTEAELLAWYQRHGFTPVSADPEGLTLRRRPGSR